MSNENEKIVDCRGLACPQPVLLTKKALDASPEALTTIVDNLVAKENVAKFATASGYGVSIESIDGLYHIRMVPNQVIIDTKASLEKSAVVETGLPVYLFTQDVLGNGSSELGAILMKAFFVSLLETSPQPRVIVLLNSGVRLALEDSPVLPALKTLEERGVTVMSCGTCLVYYNVKAKLAIGSITNMFSILAELNGPGRTITL
jgi:selenium metabolism protein YedF